MKNWPLGIDAKPEVLARDLGAAGDLHVDPRGAAAAADRERVFAHEEHVWALLVVVRQPGALPVVPGVVLISALRARLSAPPRAVLTPGRRLPVAAGGAAAGPASWWCSSLSAGRRRRRS